ncbi:MAG: polyketide synthase dehydratase domain-containing protein, partial [Silvanigrellaceae bacterium]|nr:polyketide synthase dehydratase domain-containing protein [Silvanigrellaceae bacterium]
WDVFYPQKSFISTPQYPFQKIKCWVERKISKGKFTEKDYFRDHNIQGKNMVPGALMLTKILEQEPSKNLIQDFVWIHPILTEDPYDIIVEETSCKIVDKQNPQMLYAKGVLDQENREIEIPDFWKESLSTEKKLEKEEIYTAFEKAGINYGPSFKCLNWVETNDQFSWGEIEVAESLFEINPSAIDAALQVPLISHLFLSQKENNVFVPFIMGRFKIKNKKLPRKAYVFSKKFPNENKSTATNSIYVFDEMKNFLFSIEQFVSKILST